MKDDIFNARRQFRELNKVMEQLTYGEDPNYIDGQLKVKTRFSERDELTFLGLVGIDNMKPVSYTHLRGFSRVPHRTYR